MKHLVACAILAALMSAGASADTIGHRAGRVVDDAYLLAAVRARLVTIDADSATNVHVRVDRGIVTMSGSARSYGERSAYATAAASIYGVRRVRDDVGVNPHLRGITEQGKDTALEVRVSAAILAQAGTNVFNVIPSARSGIVTLHGQVGSRDVERVVVDAARGVSGVRRVVDELSIRR